MKAAKALTDAELDKLGGDEKTGFRIVRRALEEPIRQIAENCGLDGPIVAERASREKAGVGFDARSMEWVDMTTAGIIDPVKVTRSALQNAASIAGMLLTTECLITDLPEKEQSAPAMPDESMY